MRDFPDSNAKDLYAALERNGWIVCRIRAALQKKRGVPDSMVSKKSRGPLAPVHMLEVKRPGGTLRPEQLDFAASWPGCYHVARSSWEAEQLLNDCEARQAVRAS